MKNAVIAFVLVASVGVAVLMPVFFPESRVARGYYNGESQLGLAYGCGMIAENNRLLKLQELKPTTEYPKCAQYRELWESMSQ